MRAVAVIAAVVVCVACLNVEAAATHRLTKKTTRQSSLDSASSAVSTYVEGSSRVSTLPASIFNIMGNICGGAATAPTAVPNTCVNLPSLKPMDTLREIYSYGTGLRTAEGRVLATAMTDLSSVMSKVEAFYPFQQGAGATCIPRFDSNANLVGFVVTFIGQADAVWTDNKKNANGLKDTSVVVKAQMLHELTHCRNSAAYAAWNVQYKKSPFPVVDVTGHVNKAKGCFTAGTVDGTQFSHEEYVQSQFNHDAHSRVIAANMKALGDLVPKKWATSKSHTEKYFHEKIVNYMGGGFGGRLEGDAPAIQLLYMCSHWSGCKRQTAMYAKLAAVVEEAYCRRVGRNAGTPKPAPARPHGNCRPYYA